MNTDRRVIVAPLEQAECIDKGHAVYHVLYRGEEAFSIVLHQVLRPKQFSSAHIHEAAGELYIVIEGQLELYTDQAIMQVPAGHIAYVPGGVPHRVQNLDDKGSSGNRVGVFGPF